MQEYNPDVIAAMVKARQETVLRKSSWSSLHLMTHGPIRLKIGRALVRMGERVAGRQRLPLAGELDRLPTVTWSVVDRHVSPLPE